MAEETTEQAETGGASPPAGSVCLADVLAVVRDCAGVVPWCGDTEKAVVEILAEVGVEVRFGYDYLGRECMAPCCLSPDVVRLVPEPGAPEFITTEQLGAAIDVAIRRYGPVTAVQRVCDLFGVWPGVMPSWSSWLGRYR